MKGLAETLRFTLKNGYKEMAISLIRSAFHNDKENGWKFLENFRMNISLHGTQDELNTFDNTFFDPVPGNIPITTSFIDI